jgi:regulator of protease activity HflC (stomatin/prohibitin superfamily)
MGYIVIALFWASLPFAAFFALYAVSYQEWDREARMARSASRAEPPKPQYMTGKAWACSLSMFIIYSLFAAFVVVPAGHIGVQVTLGTVSQQTLAEGVHFINPLSNVRDVEVRVIAAKMQNASAGTKDLQQVHTDIVVNYRIDGNQAAHIYKEFGFDLQDKIIMPIVNESFKAVTAHYSSEELITKRDEVSMRIKEELGIRLGKYGLTVNDVSLVNFGFSAEYQRAIEAKVTATQSKLQAEQDLQRIEVEAKQAVARAEGKAKAIQIETAAINSQGGASYVQLKAIEKWDGKLPTTQAGGVTPFINIK